MAVMNFKNTWGSAASDPTAGIDQQRSDLFHVQLQLPSVIGGVTAWDSNVAFAVEKFPFPERTREMVGIKFMNQTNFQIGADTPMPSINMTVRYPFSQQTFALLEMWHELTSNPKTGAVGLTSQVKANGAFWYWIPQSPSADFTTTSDANAMVMGGAFFLEGVLIKGFTPSQSDMTSTNGLVTAEFGLQIDRYYPVDPNDLQVTPPAPATS